MDVYCPRALHWIVQAALNTKCLHEFKGTPQKIIIKYTELNTWSNKYITKDTENTWPYIKKGCRVFWGNTTYACPSLLPTHPPEAIARGHHRRWGSLELQPDPGHPPPQCTQHLEQTGKSCYTVSLRWGGRNKATQQICGKPRLQMSCQKPTHGPRLSFLSQWSTQNGFQERRVSWNTQPQEAQKSLMRVSQASFLEQSYCSLFAQRYLPPAPHLCIPVAACSFRQLATCLLSKYYLLLTRSQGDSIKKSEKWPHCSQGSKEFLLRYSLPCVLLSCM